MRAERDDAFSVRDSIRKDRDEHIANFEELEKRSYEETTRLRRRAKGFCDTMTEIDTLLGGEYFLHPSAFFDCFLVFLLMLSFAMQRPGLNLRRLLMQQWPNPERRLSRPE